MLAIGLLLPVLAYGVGSWGYILVKGYNITAKEWFSPLKPYTGALNANGRILPGNLWPTNKPVPPNTTADSTGQATGALPPATQPVKQNTGGSQNFGTSNPNSVA